MQERQLAVAQLNLVMAEQGKLLKDVSVSGQTYAKIMEEINTKYLNQIIAADRLNSVIADAMITGIVEGKNFREVLGDIGSQMWKLYLRMLLIKSLQTGNNWIFSNFFGGGAGTPTTGTTGQTSDLGGQGGFPDVNSAGLINSFGGEAPATLNSQNQLNGGGHMTIHIDARGADPGSEQRIRRMISQSSAASVRESVRLMSIQGRRA